MTGNGSDRARAREALAEAAVLREQGQYDVARDTVAEAGVWALLALGDMEVTPRPTYEVERPVSDIVADGTVFRPGEVVDIAEAVRRAAAAGVRASETTLSNALGKAVRQGVFTRVRRGVFLRNGTE